MGERVARSAALRSKRQQQQLVKPLCQPSAVRVTLCRTDVATPCRCMHVVLLSYGLSYGAPTWAAAWARPCAAAWLLPEAMAWGGRGVRGVG